MASFVDWHDVDVKEGEHDTRLKLGDVRWRFELFVEIDGSTVEK